MAALHHTLGFLPLHGPLTAAEALHAIEHLEAAGAVEVVDAIVVEQRQDAMPRIARRRPSAKHALQRGAWTWLVGEALGSTRARAGLSASFVAEVRAVLLDTREWIAVVASALDVDAIVFELRRFPAARFVYGALPEWMLERTLTWPASDGRRAHPVTS